MLLVKHHRASSSDNNEKKMKIKLKATTGGLLRPLNDCDDFRKIKSKPVTASRPASGCLRSGLVSLIVVIVLAECARLGAAKPRGLIYNKDGKFIYRPAKAHQGHIIVIDDRHRGQNKPNNSDSDATGVANSTGDQTAETSFGGPGLAAFPATVQLIAPAQFALAAPTTVAAASGFVDHHQQRLPSLLDQAATGQLIDLNELHHQQQQQQQYNRNQLAAGQAGFADQQPAAASNAVASNYATLASVQQQQVHGQQPFHLVPMIRLLDTAGGQMGGLPGYKLFPLTTTTTAAAAAASARQMAGLSQQHQQQASAIIPTATLVAATTSSGQLTPHFAAYPSHQQQQQQIYAANPQAAPPTGADQFPLLATGSDRGDRLFEQAGETATPGLATLFEPAMYDFDQDGAGSPFSQLAQLAPPESINLRPRSQASHLQQQQQQPYQQQQHYQQLISNGRRLHPSSQQPAYHHLASSSSSANSGSRSYSPFATDYYDDYHQERGAAQQLPTRTLSSQTTSASHGKRYRDIQDGQATDEHQQQQHQQPQARKFRGPNSTRHQQHYKVQHNSLTPGHLGSPASSSVFQDKMRLQQQQPSDAHSRHKPTGGGASGERNYDHNSNSHLDAALTDESSNYWKQFKEQYEIV